MVEDVTGHGGCVVNGKLNSTLCVTSLLVLHDNACGYICAYQHMWQTSTMEEHMRTLISAI